MQLAGLSLAGTLDSAGAKPNGEMDQKDDSFENHGFHSKPNIVWICFYPVRDPQKRNAYIRRK